MTILGLLAFLMGFCFTSIAAHWIRDVGSSIDLNTPKKVVIDTDAGVDDAGAILLALEAEKLLPSSGFQIIAITCSYGNTDVSNVGTNVLKTLTIGGRSNIPVYIGAHKPLLKERIPDDYFGKDGFGDISFDEDIVGTVNKSKHASVALTDLAKEHAGELSIIALGPLTNLALAIAMDRDFLSNIKRLYIMGASVHGLGNIGPAVEFNFYQDPESNFIVLNKTSTLRTILIPWETALSPAIPMEWRRYDLGAVNSRIMNFLNQIESKNFGSAIWASADLTAIAVALWPELITRTIVTNVTPVFDGAAKGSVLVDYPKKTGKKQNAEIIDSFDVEKYKELLLKAFA